MDTKKIEDELIVEIAWFMRDMAKKKLGMTDYEEIVRAMIKKGYINELASNEKKH